MSRADSYVTQLRRVAERIGRTPVQSDGGRRRDADASVVRQGADRIASLEGALKTLANPDPGQFEGNPFVKRMADYARTTLESRGDD